MLVHQFPTLFMGTVEVIAILSGYAPIFSSFLAPLHLGSAQQVSINASSLRITPVYLLGWALIYIGWHIRTSAFEELGTQFTYKLRVSEKHRLVTTGSYSHIRHPSYAGGLLFIIGGILTQLGPGSLWSTYPASLTLSLIVKSWVCFCIVSLGYTVLRAHGEERMLKAGFGKEWLAYTVNTPYMFIPYVF